MVRKRKFGKDFKAKVALAALKGDQTTAELSSKYEVHSTMINRWVKKVKESLPAVFVETKEKDQDKDKLIEYLYKRIGQLSIENEWLKKNLWIKSYEKTAV